MNKQRVLKFRAFQGGKMHQDVVVYHGQFFIPVEHEHYLGIDFSNAFAISEWSSNYLMQYTGRKDKNGIEIYEGDVLKDVSKYKCGCPNCGEDSHYNPSFAVGNLGYAFSVKYSSGEYPIDSENKFNDCEIIGNIHENPELI